MSIEQKTPAFESGVEIRQIMVCCGFLAQFTLAFEDELVLEIYLVMVHCVYLTPYTLHGASCTKQFKLFKWWGVEI